MKHQVEEEIIEPTPERWQHDIIERAQQARYQRQDDDPPLRVTTQTFLDRYLQRELISEDQHDAGEQLFADWKAGGSQRVGVAGYDAIRVDGGGRLGLMNFEAQDRVTAALQAVGQRYAAMLVHVCICDESARYFSFGKQKQVGKKGIFILKDALDCLISHYRKRKSS